MTHNPALLIPDWPAPPNVRAVCSTRLGGVSGGVFASMNLGQHVGDKPEHVSTNRQRFARQAQMPASPVWLAQVHGTQVQRLTAGSPDDQQADAGVSCDTGVVCTVMTADCLPLLLCDTDGTQVAAVHAGWRGLCEGVIENTITQFATPAKVMAYLGPAISQSAFEVGSEVRSAFMTHASEAEQAFYAGTNGKWQADLYQLARQRLAACGVVQIYGGSYCTYRQAELFFSYRRDGQTGRMASSIWLV
jgi:polyphenol oxidase